MGIFGRQIKERENADQEMFTDSLNKAGRAILGKQSIYSINVHYHAINQVFSYFRLDPVDIPQNIEKFIDQTEYCCHMRGVMQREVKLEGKWYKDSCGPLIVFRKEDDQPVALIPKKTTGYHFYDPTSKNYKKLTRLNSQQFKAQAYCYYKPLPDRPLKIFDLLKYAVHTWSYFDVAYVIGLSLIAALIGTLLPLMNTFLFDYVAIDTNYSLLASTIVFIFSASVAIVIFNAIRTLFVNRLNTKMGIAIEAAMMIRVLYMPSSFFREYSSGDISQRMNYATELCESILVSIFTSGLTGLFSLVYIFQIFVEAPAMAPLALSIVIITMLFNAFIIVYQSRINIERMEIASYNSGIMFSLISGLQKIKTSGAEKRMFSLWSDSFANEATLQYSPPFILRAAPAITSAITIIGQFLIYTTALSADLTVGYFYGFTTAYGMVSGAFASLTSVVALFANVVPSLNMIKPLLNAKPEIIENKRILNDIDGRITFDQITFKYDKASKNIIDDLSLDIHPGDYVAIVGKTGCGKSTLVKLLIGFEKPQRGTIYYDGVDLEQLDLSYLRRKIGTVIQDDKLFSGSIFSNISICDPGLTMDDAWEAAKIADIDNDIKDMPMGMLTEISEGSGGISGGQRQRLLIARAIASKPQILILDEATSALDNIAQKNVSDALSKLGCTRLVIAHRLSTVKLCDKILCMDDGKIIEEGTYDELMKKKGFFHDLVREQQLK